jgi:purine nucleoside permease
MKLSRILSVLAIIFVAGSLVAHAAPYRDQDKSTRHVKVMVITMFGTNTGFGETNNWVSGEHLTDAVPVPGLSANFPNVYCTVPDTTSSEHEKGDSDVCVITTDIGYANAASSITALLHSGLFDLHDTYFLVAGIAGVDPHDGTLGSAAWARWVVDFGLAHEIDAREMPSDWPYGYTGFGGALPLGIPPAGTGAASKPRRTIGTEVYHLNEALAQRAFDLSQATVLFDNADSQAYRAHYTDPTPDDNFLPARSAPSVIMCDSVAVDTYWHGVYLSKRANDWAKLLTNGVANYCMTNEEDNATMTALNRGAQAGLLSFDRVAVLRTASNFDQQYPGQTNGSLTGAYASLNTRSGGFLPSTINAFRVGDKLVRDIVDNWSAWQAGIPAAAAGSLTVHPK